MPKKALPIFIAILFLFAGMQEPVAAQESPLVNAVEVRGLKRIEEGAVKARITHGIGEPLSQDKVNDDIKSIFKMGYFDDVKVEIETFEGGVRLIYQVKEKPTIVRVDFQGNTEFDDGKLKEKITVTSGAIADTVLIQDNAVKLRKFYEEEGYWLANVVPVIRKISDDEVGLTYQISEGRKVKIRKISVEGNARISTSKIKKAMETKEWWLFSFVTSAGYYNKERMETDVERIRNLFLNEGYLKVIIAEPELTLDADGKGMRLLVKISEGDQYRAAGVGFAGNTVYDNATIGQKVSMTTGNIFSKKQLEKDMLAISDLYSQNGYALVTVTPDLEPDEKSKTVAVTLRIDEGDRYRMGRIEISGNTKTRDKVIRREFRVDEGEIYDSSKLKRSYERINNLNFFDTVEMAPKPRYEEKVVDLEVKVKERPTGFLSVGGGYSSVDKFIFTVDLTQGNLFGKGQYIKLKGELGGRSSFYEFAFRDPYFLDKPLSFSTGIYRHTREYVEYDKKAFGAYVGLGKSLSEYWKGDITYNFERATIESIDEGASTVIKDQEGTRTTSSITPTIVRDSRDNYLDPTRGSRNSVTFTFAGLGGSNAFIKGVIDSGWYFPIGQTALMFRGRFGYAQGIFGKELPLYERFYVGGIYTIRGLGFGEAGPRDKVTKDVIGGTEELILNTEYIFPIFPEMRLKGLVFFDAGNAYEDFENFGELRYTAGLGVRWISPFGPIRLEWGYNLEKKEGESASKFEFAFGSFF